MQACAPTFATSVAVRADSPHTTVRYLDDIEWRQRTEFGRAYSDWTFLCTSNFKFDKPIKEDGNYVFVVEAVDVKLGLELVETLPIGVKDPLRKHEDMHCQMTAECYKDAEQTATKIAKEMIGKRFVVSSAADETAAEKAALLDARRAFAGNYKEQTSMVADKLAVIFDRVTNHGLNGVSNADGRQKSLDEYKEQKVIESTSHKEIDLQKQKAAQKRSSSGEDEAKLEPTPGPKVEDQEGQRSQGSPESTTIQETSSEKAADATKSDTHATDSQKWQAPIIESARTESTKAETDTARAKPNRAGH